MIKRYNLQKGHCNEWQEASCKDPNANFNYITKSKNRQGMKPGNLDKKQSMYNKDTGQTRGLL